jgi:hypothetical protein
LDWQAAIILDQLILAGCFKNDAQVTRWIRGRYNRFTLDKSRLARIRPSVLIIPVVLTYMTGRTVRLLRVWFYICEQARLICSSARRMLIWFDGSSIDMASWKDTTSTRIFTKVAWRRRAPRLSQVKGLIGKVPMNLFTDLPVVKRLQADRVKFLTAVQATEPCFWCGSDITDQLKSQFFHFKLFGDYLSGRASGSHVPKLLGPAKLGWKWVRRIMFLLAILESRGHVYRMFSVSNLLYIHVVLTLDNVFVCINRSSKKPFFVPRRRMVVLPRAATPWLKFAFPFNEGFESPSFLGRNSTHFGFARMFRW